MCHNVYGQTDGCMDNAIPIGLQHFYKGIKLTISIIIIHQYLSEYGFRLH